MFLLKQSIIKFWNWKGIQQLSALTLSLGEAWVQRNVQVWALKCLHIFMQHFLSFVTICFCQGLCLQHYLLHCPITVIWNVCVCVCVPSASHPGPGTEKVLREGWVQHHKRWPTEPLEAALVLSYLRVASLPLGVIRSPVGGPHFIFSHQFTGRGWLVPSASREPGLEEGWGSVTSPWSEG